MKKFVGRGRISLFMMVFAIALSFVSCKKEIVFEAPGVLNLSFSPDYQSYTMNKFKDQLSKAGVVVEIPDTNMFYLCIKNEQGNTVYYDNYGNKPDRISLNPGAYEVSVVSYRPTRPEFDQPVFGDVKNIYMESGGCIDVSLNCIQLNSGIRIRYSANFRERYQGASIKLRNATDSLYYNFNETRIAYFNPERVSLHMYHSDKDVLLLSRLLNSGEILTVNFTCPALPTVEDHITISLDTTRIWVNENVYLSNPGTGATKDAAYSVSEAKYKVGETDVWVKGYIVGNFNSGGTLFSEPPFSSDTNIAISDYSMERDKQYMIAVRIKDSLRTMIGLNTNSSNLGKVIYMKGDISTDGYMGTTCFENIDEYYLE